MTQDHYIDDESDRGSIISAIRKTKSIDASCLDMRSLGDVVNSSTMNMPRAKSEFNLTTTAMIECKFFEHYCFSGYRNKQKWENS